jgi:tetratricopeptide (TPR) repeat protein
MVAQELREWAEARRYYQQALDIFIEFNDRYAQAGTYACLGILAAAEEDYAAARANYQQALERYLEFGDDRLADFVRQQLEKLLGIKN